MLLRLGFLLCFLLLQLRPCFPARNLAGSVSVIQSDDSPPGGYDEDVLAAQNATWQGFTRFLDAGVGARVPGISELKRYFTRFGYLSFSDPGNITDVFDKSFESAVVKYQTNLGLPVTGKLDSGTITSIMSPRCGVTDEDNDLMGRVTRHYAYFSGRPRWARGSPSTLTYAFTPEPDHTITYLPQADVRAAFQRAFSRWSSVIPVSFEEAEEYYAADIRIGFYHGDHGDGEPFDGVLGVLGHAFSPENGRLHLDGAERWSVDFKEERSKAAVDLESVATHEIGHVLGLGHSSVKEAVMYPSLSPRTRKVELRIDDVEGVQALYGSNPNFKLSSLLESESSSNHAGRELRDIRCSAAVWATASSAVVAFILLFV